MRTAFARFVPQGSPPGRFVAAWAILCCAVLTPVAIADVDFDRQVAPIIAAHCLECHAGNEPRGGLALSHGDRALKGGESGPAIVSGRIDSLLLQRVVDDEMPPKKPLSSEDKKILRQWIVEGAKWGTSPIDPFAVTTSARAGYDWWSLQPLARRQPPQTDHKESIRNPIDAFVQARLADAQLTQAPQADPRSLIRRLYFDLIGLPPTPVQTKTFLADPSDQAYEKVVDELLASPHYGERWGRHWLDVVRFGESDGFERNAPRKTAWPYRDWVISALNSNMPYDEFVRMQLIGDQLSSGPDGAAATGFWVAGVHNTVVGGSKRMKLLARQDEIEEVLATVGQTFVGLTVNCARCHDHKFDPISQQEFYELASAISGLGYGEREVKSADDQKTLNEINQRIESISSELAKIDNEARQQILAARAAGKVAAPEPPAPLARWEFEGNLLDSLGPLHGKAHGNARVENGALIVDGSSFVETAPIGSDIREKTLEAWVQLNSLEQAGGGVITIQTRNGVIFDSIVFAERQAGHWMAGSNGFARYEPFQGSQEQDAVKRPVHVAIVYQTDGTIHAFRDGVAYGKPMHKAPLQSYTAGDAEIIFGLRHEPSGGNRNLQGRILRAAFYDRALSADEVAASFGNTANYVPEKQIVEWLSNEKKQQRSQLAGQLAEQTKLRNDQAALANRKVYTLNPGPGATTHVLLRGDPENPGPLVTPGAVSAVVGVQPGFHLPADAPDADRRKALAAWITHPDNPMFARVIVNRIWHYHFGTGIVDTPNDLGFNGGRPSHPQLLEWLAVHFRDNGLRLKSLHRLIVMSATFRQSSQSAVAPNRADPATIDANNRLLWRMNPRRLEAESLRDSLLAVAGKLNAQTGGPGFEDVSIISNNGTTYYEPIDVDGEPFFRRTVYRFNPRGGRSALLDTFDCPDPAATAPRRSVTTTPLQALSLLNNSFVLSMSAYFAERIQQEVGSDAAVQIRHAWELALARQPSAEEFQLAVPLVRTHGLAALCRGLFNCNEFVIVD